MAAAPTLAMGLVDTPPTKRVWGIAELFEWVINNKRCTGRDSEDFLQAHLDTGIKSVMWAVGRSTVDYHSALPTSTMYDGDPRPATQVIGEAFRRRCSLRTALAFASEHGMTIYARLGMNRHYGDSYGGKLRSKFAADHREIWCLKKNGKADSTRLSYFFPAYRQERLGILLEVAQIGAHGLCLDFCRQPPIMGYEEPVIAAYRQQGGSDPRQLKPGDAEFLKWCAFRAGYVTAFLRELRAALRKLEARLGRRVPVLARITDGGLDLNLMEGMDVRTWAAEKLVDEICTDSFWIWNTKYPDTLTPYVEVAKQHGLTLYGGVGCLAAQGTAVNPVAFLRRVERQYTEGAAGVALYQSDTGCVNPLLTGYIPNLSDPQAVSRLAHDAALAEKWPQRELRFSLYGLDNHSAVEALGKKMPLDLSSI